MVEKKLLPSISMLASFDATARSGSFSAAARELNLTHGAVSRQIAALEFQLDTALVIRSPRGVRLSGVGKRYAVDVRAALTALRDATLEVINEPKGSTIDLAILPTFGTRWLMPRFPKFLEINPDVSVNFITRLSRFELDEGNVDAAIHFGTAHWPGADCTFLMQEQAVPVCSPTLLKHAVETPERDFHGLPLLHLESRPDAWTEWFDSQGIDIPSCAGAMVFEQFSIVAHAAVAGLGVALLPHFLIRAELARGELVILSDQAPTSEMGYYLVTPESKSQNAPIVALREWLLNIIASERLAPAQA